MSATPPLQVLPVGPPSALSPEQILQIQEARARSRTIRRAVTWAMVDGWTLGVFGGLSLLFGITSLAGWLVGGGLIAIAVIEVRTASALKRLDPSAPRRLGWNQVVLGALLLAYAVWGMWWAHYGRIDSLEQVVAQSPELGGFGEIESLVRTLTLVVYAVLAVVAVVGPGLSALYYFTRQRHVVACIEQTPAWIMDLQRRGVTL